MRRGSAPFISSLRNLPRGEVVRLWVLTPCQSAGEQCRSAAVPRRGRGGVRDAVRGEPRQCFGSARRSRTPNGHGLGERPRAPRSNRQSRRGLWTTRNASQVPIRFNHIPPKIVAFGLCESRVRRPELLTGGGPIFDFEVGYWSEVADVTGNDSEPVQGRDGCNARVLAADPHGLLAQLAND